MTEPADKKPRRPRRGKVEMTVEQVGKLPLDDLEKFAAKMREDFPKVAAFLVGQMKQDEPKD